MNELGEAIKGLMEPYSFIALIGIITLSLMLALLVIGFCYRVFTSFSLISKYEASYKQVAQIEEKLNEMRAQLDTTQREYDRMMMEAKQEFERELFQLQQMIFERNSEIIDLKTKLLQVAKNKHEPVYS